MSHPTLRAEVRRELQRGIDSCDSCMHHLIQAAKLCGVAKSPESGDTLEAIGEIVYLTKGMIEQFRQSI